MTYAERIHKNLSEGLSPAHLEVIDESHLHAGHAGARPEGETHFRVEIVSDAFSGKSRVERQRMVYGLLRSELEERVHALALKTQTPQETAA